MFTCWVFEVSQSQVLSDIVFDLSQSDLQYKSLNSPKPVRTNAVVEASIKDLVLDWVFKQLKDHHDHLPYRQILQ